MLYAWSVVGCSGLAYTDIDACRAVSVQFAMLQLRVSTRALQAGGPWLQVNKGVHTAQGSNAPQGESKPSKLRRRSYGDRSASRHQARCLITRQALNAPSAFSLDSIRPSHVIHSTMADHTHHSTIHQHTCRSLQGTLQPTACLLTATPTLSCLPLTLVAHQAADTRLTVPVQEVRRLVPHQHTCPKPT